MLSKCANPECAEVFRYLRQGKLFHLRPSPTVEASAIGRGLVVNERFWLCDVCAKEMTVTWSGTRAEIVPLSKIDVTVPLPPPKGPQRLGHVPPGRYRLAAKTAEVAERGAVAGIVKNGTGPFS